jgi:anthranilate phosphoribosyltransferase
MAAILTRSIDENASVARGVLEGEPGAARDVVVANAALALYVAGKCETMADAAGMAMESIDNGRALEKLRLLAETAAA